MLKVDYNLPERSLMIVSNKLKIPYAKSDKGYLAHTVMSLMLGDDAPKPFFIRSKHHGYYLLSGVVDEWELEEEIDLKTLTTPYPAEPAKNGQRWCFDVFVAIVKRKAQSGREVDPYEDGSKEERREDVYTEWIEERFGDAVALENVELNAWTRIRSLRRTQGVDRHPKVVPVVGGHFTGKLLIKNKHLFLHLLRKGIGRHKAFGFGMIRLGDTPC